jgi:hypothetical protein
VFRYEVRIMLNNSEYKFIAAILVGRKLRENFA